MEPTTFTLHSAPFLHAPGFVRFVRDVSRTDRPLAERLAKECFPALSPRALMSLFAGRFTVGPDDTVQVTEAHPPQVLG
jgi:hypothetical protein